MIIVIDGARYSETFGDTTYQYIPRMQRLARGGTIASQFYNDSITYTSRAIPALWCGTWTDIRDTTYAGSFTQYTVKPTIFEYYRKQKNLPAGECYYLIKYINSLWLPSFDQDYGPDYWPEFHSQGRSDEEVAIQTQLIINSFTPHFLWVYLADVDAAGHSGDWSRYTMAIQIADSIVGLLWDRLQSNPFYKDSTYLFVTNDHGRHDDQHGGFQHHGDQCEGCRHILFLALGPGMRQNYVSNTVRNIPDLTVTACRLLGINAIHATGQMMDEILQPDYLKDPKDKPVFFSLKNNYPNPFNSSTRIEYSLSRAEHVELIIYDSAGKKIITLLNRNQMAGEHRVYWNGVNTDGLPASSGLYFYRLNVENHHQSKKMLLLR